MDPCPSDDDLRRFLDIGEALGVGLHLRDCGRCQSSADRLSDDGTLGAWAASLAGGTLGSIEADELSRLVARLCERDSAAGPWGGQGEEPASALLDPPEAPGDLGTLGPYAVEAEIGRGGMGVVYRAREAAMGRVVALKVLRPELADDRARRRFVREVRAAAGVEHDHIVRLYATSGPADRVPYFAMEYLAGPSLAGRLRAGDGLAPREAAEVAAQVADGLAAAHAAGLVHRDVKPANILFDPATGRAKVADFGLARAAARSIVETREGTIAGTPAYMSPEQARGQDDLDAQSDVYSLGATLYEALAGELPFRGAPQMVLRQILDDDPRPPRRLNDAVPRDLETICLKAMAKEPARRYASAAEFRDDLRRWPRGEPIRARPAGPAERLWRLARRRPIAAGLSAALALMLVVGSAAVTVLWRRAEANADRARAHLADSDRSFRQARDVVDRFYRDFYLSNQLNSPALAPVRREAVRLLVDYYRGFLRDRGGDPSLRAEVAEASLRIGQLTTQVGDTRDALAALVQARDLFRLRVEADPGDREAHGKLSGTEMRLAEALNVLARWPEALEVTRAHIDRIRRLVAAAPDDREWRTRLGVATGTLANIHAARNDPDGAARAYREALDQFRALLRLDPASASTRAQLSMTLKNLAPHLPEPRDRVVLLGEALAIRRGLSAETPIDWYLRRNVARTLHALGMARADSGDRAEGLRDLEEARAILHEVNRTAEGMAIHIGDEASVDVDLAGQLLDLHRPEPALAATEEALRLLGQARRIDPENFSYPQIEARAHLVRARLHEEAGQIDLALRSRRARLELLDRASRERPDDPDARDELVGERRAIEALSRRPPPNPPRPVCLQGRA